jgi:hypothetical protein
MAVADYFVPYNNKTAIILVNDREVIYLCIRCLNFICEKIFYSNLVFIHIL